MTIAWSQTIIANTHMVSLVGWVSLFCPRGFDISSLCTRKELACDRIGAMDNGVLKND